jgi:hypothetical protein
VALRRSFSAARLKCGSLDAGLDRTSRTAPILAVSSSRLKVDQLWLECPMLKTSVISSELTFIKLSLLAARQRR